MSENYAHPEALVETDWLEKHLEDGDIRVVESNEDVLLYDTGHIPGAVHIDWRADLQDPVIRDYIQPEKFAELCSKNGITPDTTCIFYGDKSNWWACYALWAFRLFGHENVKILNGGRDKWKAEGRPMTRESRKYPKTNYPVPKKRSDKEIRAFADEALAQSKAGKPLIDVRSPGEYRGEVTHMPEYPQEGVLRGGHIPGAKSVPWKTATNDDATFKSVEELRKIYIDNAGVKPETDTIVYCRIGERSSHTWFVLSYLLGLDNVRNYDGSWTEWGNKVAAPIEKGVKQPPNLKACPDGKSNALQLRRRSPPTAGRLSRHAENLTQHRHPSRCHPDPAVAERDLAYEALSTQSSQRNPQRVWEIPPSGRNDNIDLEFAGVEPVRPIRLRSGQALFAYDQIGPAARCWRLGFVLRPFKSA